MIKNLEGLLPTASCEDVYFYLGYYHGLMTVINRAADSDAYFNKEALQAILGIGKKEETGAE